MAQLFHTCSRDMRALLFSLSAALPARAAPPVIVTPEVISTRPHDAGAYTQGLLFHDGRLYESTGGYGGSSYGPSTLREVDPATGTVLRSVTLDGGVFAEGLARVGDQLIQLTWQEGVALVWDITTLTEVDRFTYSGQGWGLCYDGSRLVMSNGSSRLAFRDPTDFRVLGHLDVTLEHPPGTINQVNGLNELECVGGAIYANLYTTEGRWIVAVDVDTGVVTRWIQAPGLHPELTGLDHVLNGIAFDPASGHFLITGKLWPHLFEVRLDAPTADGGPAVPDGDSGRPAGARVAANGCAATACGWSVLWVAALVRGRAARQLS